MSWDSLAQWKELERESGARLYVETGMLWMGHAKDERTEATLRVLAKVGIPHERLDRAELERRYPQIAFGDVTWAGFEPKAGALFARRGVQTVSRLFEARGGRVILGRAAAPASRGRVESIAVGSERLTAGSFVYACGPWLGRLFPEVLGDRIFPTRQAVFYFGPPPGDDAFAPPKLPVWIDFGTEYYGIPDLETKGFKVAHDKHGPRFDPDAGERVPLAAEIAAVRAFVAERFPRLKGAPVVGAEVCQYENSSNGDFLVDRHPDHPNVWLVGGGSGHGFKHGPGLGAFVADRVEKGDMPEPRFSLATKANVQNRAVH
jgi:glycine/D-amino acid oxidase-like deaminating enzyme